MRGITEIRDGSKTPQLRVDGSQVDYVGEQLENRTGKCVCRVK
jgi:hypothetical protein